jgi:hypothetical protein
MKDSQLINLILITLLIVLSFYIGSLWFRGWLKRARTPRPFSTNTRDARGALKLQPIKDFEYETVRLIQATTGKEARLSNSVGLVDIEVFDQTGHLMGIVQCVPLALAYTLAASDVRAMREIKQRLHVKIAYIVTSGRFEREAQEEAKRLGIKLLDGSALQRLRQRYSQVPSTVPAVTSPADDSQWQRPRASAPSSKPVALFQPGAPRHILITGTPTVIVPHETVDPLPVPKELYTPSIRPAEPAVWPTRATTRHNMPTVLIKTADPASLPDSASAEQRLQARKFKSNRTESLKRPNDG